MHPHVKAALQKAHTLTLDKPRRWVANMAADCAFESVMGARLLDLLAGRLTSSAKADVAFIWCGLVTEDPELKFEDVAGMLSLLDLPRVTGELRAAIVAMLPDPDEDAAPNPPVASDSH